MTILALDPDLFWAATVNGRCNYLLEVIAEKIQDGVYQLALDSATVEAEFIELYNQFVRQAGGNEKTITQIYGPVVKGFRNKVVDLSSEPITDQIPALNKTLEQFLADNECQTPVEPELARMAYRGRSRERNDSTVIVLVGDDIPCSEIKLRSRRLMNATISIQLEKLRIRIQSASTLVPPVRDLLFKPDLEPSHYHAQNFEQAVCLKMINIFNGRPLDPVPLAELDLGKKEDIDVYLVGRTEQPPKVWIGECRLYKEGNESEWIESKKVQQLCERLPKVKRYEERQPGCSGEVEIYGFLISNAGFIDRANWLWLVNEMKKYNIQIFFYQAILEDGWARPDGKLRIKKLKHIEAPFDESYYSDVTEESV